MNIQGKTVVITGGAAGIGRAAALRLAERGAARIIIVDIDTAGMADTAQLVERPGTVAETHAVDLGNLDTLAEWLDGIGGYDILLNNAGIVSGAPQFPDAGLGKLRFIVDLNLTAVVVATQIAVNAMQRRGGGVIVNTVSTVVLTKGFSDALYAATKAGVMMFTRCCASLKDSHNVRVMGVLPGLTNTPILKKTGADGEYAPWMAPILAGNSMCRPDDIADGIVDLIEDDTLAGGDWVAVRRIDGVVERVWGHDEP